MGEGGLERRRGGDWLMAEEGGGGQFSEVGIGGRMRVGEVTDTRQRNEVKEEKEEGKTVIMKPVFSVITLF